MFRYKKLSKLICLAFLLPAASANAQHSSHGSEQIKQEYLITPFRQMAPTFLNITDYNTLGETYFSGNTVSGDFHRAQEPDKTYQVRFNSHRYQKLKSARLYGGFAFTQEWNKDVTLSENLEPYRGNPYTVGDSLAGNWKKQWYNLELDFTTAPILSGKVYPGISLNYKVGTGARQEDPRPLVLSNNLTIDPALMWKLGEQHFIGAKGIFGFYTEDVSLEVKNPNNNYNLYKMMGPVDVFDVQRMTYVSGLTRNYKGKTVGGGLQYAFQSDDLTVAIAGNIHKRTEDVLDGVTNPLKAGTLNETGYLTSAVAIKRSASALNKFELQWNQYDREGTEYHQRLVSTDQHSSQLYETVFEGVFTTMLQTDAVAQYSFMSLTENASPKWLLSASAGYHGYDSRYLYPNNTQVADVMRYSVGGGHNWESGPTSFLFQLNLSLQHKLTSELELAPAEGSAYVLDHLFRPDHAYLTSSWIKPGFLAVFSNRIKDNTSWFVRASGSFLQPAKSSEAYLPKGTREAFQISIGIIH